MMGTVPAVLFDALPWWLALPALVIGLLATGMALDETYVNRTTVLAGALALAVYSVVGGGLWLPLALYLDVGLVVGAYGLYAYVVDGYVGNWFRVLAYFVYSPLAIFLVVLFPDVLFVVALVLAGYANLQLLAYFHPVEPYYFGPESEEIFAEVADEAGAPEPAVGDSEPARGSAASGEAAGAGASGAATPPAGGTGGGPSGAGGATADPAAPGAPRPNRTDPAAATPAAEAEADGGTTERGILPEFMRRL